MVSSRWNSRLFLGSISKWNSLLTRVAVAFIDDFFPISLGLRNTCQSVWAYPTHASHASNTIELIGDEGDRGERAAGEEHERRKEQK
jgi:hypothetical protein